MVKTKGPPILQTKYFARYYSKHISSLTLENQVFINVSLLRHVRLPRTVQRYTNLAPRSILFMEARLPPSFVVGESGLSVKSIYLLIFL